MVCNRLTPTIGVWCASLHPTMHNTETATRLGVKCNIDQSMLTPSSSLNRDLVAWFTPVVLSWMWGFIPSSVIYYRRFTLEYRTNACTSFLHEKLWRLYISS